MCAQGSVLFANALTSFVVMGGNWPMLKHTSKLAFSRLLCGRCCKPTSIGSTSLESGHAPNDGSDPHHLQT